MRFLLYNRQIIVYYLQKVVLIMEFLRKFAKSRLGQFSMLIILAPMAFLGISSGFGGGNRVADEVIHVDDTSISLKEVQSSINEQRKILIANGVDASLINEDVLQEQVIKNLINRVLLQKQAQKLGYTASDAFITKQLAQLFKDSNGKFSNELFANYLRQTGMVKDQLFAQKRQELAIQQLTKGIASTAIYPLSAIEALIDLQLTEKNVWVNRIAWTDFVDDVMVSDTEIKDYYNQHGADLKSIPMVDLSYIELNPDDMEVTEVTAEELQQQYDNYKTENNLSDMRQLSQILLTGDDAETKAKEVQAKLAKGADFAKIAKEYSDDLTAEEGGAIGKFNPAMFKDDAKVVEEALVGLKVGEVSAPVKTNFGIQIFKVTANDGDKVPTLEELKEELTKKAEDYKKQSLFADKVARINNLATDGYTIEEIAKEENITVKQIKDYQKTDNKTTLAEPIVIEHAFDEFTIQNQSVSQVIDLNKAKIWVQPANYRPSKSMSLKEATPIIDKILVQQKATDLAFAKAEELAKTVLTKDNLTEFTSLGAVNRQSSKLDSKEVQIIFAENATDENELLVKATKTENGASVVVTDNEKIEPKETLDKKVKANLAQTIVNGLGENQLADYLAYLNASAKVEINQDKINNTEGL